MADSHGLLYEGDSYKIRGCFFNVYNSLGFGHKEVLYQRALEEEFKKQNVNYEKEKSLAIHYNGKKIGVYRPDFVVKEKIIIEMKVRQRPTGRELCNYT